MRFVLDGETFEVTPDQVRARLAGREPDRIQEYWVEIDGRHWPVKQALSLALGVGRGRFVSTTARRHLRKLGFVVNNRPNDDSVTAPGSLSDLGQFDPAALPLVDSVTAVVSLTWRHIGSVTLDDQQRPVFPVLPHLAGLYRLEFHPASADARGGLYIGETTDLARRASNYRNATSDNTSQRTSRRIHRRLVTHLGERRGRVDLAIAVDVSLGVDTAPVDLRRKSARLLAENTAVLLAQLDGDLEVFNIDADLPTTGNAHE